MFIGIPFEDKLITSILGLVILIIVFGYYKIKEVRRKKSKSQK